jgi:hypothetical protein
MISPVYSYNEVNLKIYNAVKATVAAIKRAFDRFVIQPLVKIYEILKYIVLFRWVPVVVQYLRSFFSAVLCRLDQLVFKHVRSFFARAIQILRYWLFFHWLGDLTSWLNAKIYAPLKEKLLAVRDGIVYVVFGYWLKPLSRLLWRASVKVSSFALSVLNKCAKAVANSVLWPIIVVCYGQLRALSVMLYGILLEPVVTAAYRKYKMVEDMLFIYLLGPFFKKVVDAVPEKNPFSYESDKELDDFLPTEESRPSPSDSDVSSISVLGSDDEEHYLAKGLTNIDIDSDSSNEEFFLHTKPRKRRKAVGS